MPLVTEARGPFGNVRLLKRMTDIQKADPKALRTGLAIVVGGAILGVALIWMAGDMRPDFEAWIKEDVHTRSRMVLVVLTLATTAPALGIAGYLWRLGQRIVRTERYPPPGLRIFRDMPVVTGEAAGRHGRRVQAFAAVIGLAGLLLAFFLWRFVFLLGGGAA